MEGDRTQQRLTAGKSSMLHATRRDYWPRVSCVLQSLVQETSRRSCRNRRPFPAPCKLRWMRQHPWGVKVEKAVRLPVQLQQVMATEAEAREVRAKVIAERELRAHSLKETSDIIFTSPTALQIAPFKVRRTALKARISKRIRIMAQPKYVTKKYDPATAPPPYPRVHPKTLAAKSTKRIIDLALPKRRVLLDRMRLAVGTEEMKTTINDLLMKLRKSRYRRYRVFCMARQEREARKKRRRMAKLRKALTKPEDWQRHMRVLERLAAPKVVKRNLSKRKKFRKKKKWRPYDKERLESLSLPIVRPVAEVKDPFGVSPPALHYKITKRIEKLAIEKERPMLSPRIPGVVSKAALKAVASERTAKLAKPAVRPAGRETDLRPDAFTVSPMALKARCSRRLKMLAKPKVYPTPKFKRLRTALRKK